MSHVSSSEVLLPASHVIKLRRLEIEMLFTFCMMYCLKKDLIQEQTGLGMLGCAGFLELMLELAMLGKSLGSMC